MIAAPSGRGPVPQGRYIAARRHGDLVFTAGMTPRRDGVLVATGPVRTSAPLETYREAVVLACANALAAARGVLSAGEQIAAVLSLTVYVAAESDFTAHSGLADFASHHLHGELGERGIGARAAVGVATLPGNAPVEVQIVAAVGNRQDRPAIDQGSVCPPWKTTTSSSPTATAPSV